MLQKIYIFLKDASFFVMVVVSVHISSKRLFLFQYVNGGGSMNSYGYDDDICGGNEKHISYGNNDGM